MATTTPIRPVSRVGGAPGERATAPLGLEPQPVRNAFELLDHRSRSRAIPARHAPSGHYVSLLDSENEEMLIPIAEGITHVGRRSSSDLRFDEVHVSRRHAILVRYGHHVRVLDDRSSGGTFVDGHRVVAIDLESGDTIQIGRLLLTYARIY